jgi:carboxylesterase type B
MSPEQPFITVASNYRLGALGWVSSDIEPDVDANTGLWDALAALEWTKEYISYFGGDPDDIIVVGESSGGGIAQHLITAFGGEGEVPFNKAVLTSPGYRPHVNRSEGMANIYEALLNATGCADVACLRTLDTEALAQAQVDLYDIPSEGWLGPDIGYGPIIDGDLVTDVPDRLLAQGKWNKNVKKVLAANMALDGLGGTVGTFSLRTSFANRD